MNRMKNLMAVFAFWGMFSLGFSVSAAEKPSHEGHGDTSGKEVLEHDATAGTFNHKEAVDGIRAEFQIMSLASMKMKDPGGATHHVMVKVFDDSMNHQIRELAGKIKVIAPSGKDQIAALKNYGGVYAANFTLAEKGRYGVICLLKVKDKKYTVKFWYPHE